MSSRFAHYLDQLMLLNERVNQEMKKARWHRMMDRRQRGYRIANSLPPTPAPGYVRVRHPAQRERSLAPLRREKPKRRKS